ncbi:unnamed protein product [Protopolystoma xenopodis]|uniref:Tetratricopeptide repeat protein 5 OB fold domain-containing protein n=1 Tax=Protopolystoma xenopodis TaxID=117903 RepID=A0A448WD92_9PLAT|nr:unnamed protein product [Protopolystoma xenopodis]
MVFCSDDVRHMTDESSASIYRGCRAVRRGPIRTNLQPQLQGNPLQLPGTMAAAKVQLSSCSLDSQSNKSISTQPSRQHDQRRVLAGGRQHRGSTRPALKTGTRKSLATLLQSLDLNSLPHLQLMSFTQLQDGPNHGCICVGRVLATLPADSDLALPLLLVDPWGSVLPFRIFAIGQGLGPSVKDILAIPDPYIANVSVPHRVIKAVFRLSRLLDGDDEIGNHGDVDDSDNDDGGSSESSLFLPPASSESAESADSALKKMKASGRPDFHWRLIRIASPDVLVVNSRSVGRAWNAPVCLRNIFFTAG